MTIKPLVQNLQYFEPLSQNLQYFKHSNNVIKASEIDNRINDIVNYLNDEIIFKINNINNNTITGSVIQSDINSILKSKSTNGYLWKKINNYDFSIKTINIKKLNYKNISNSIFKANYNGDIELIQNQNISNNTIICDNNGVRFDKLNHNFINPLTKITGDKIQFNTITANNLININPSLSDNSIIGTHFKEKVITTEKIINNNITLDSFNNELQDLLKNKIWKSIIPKNFINLNTDSNKYIILNNWDKNFLIYKAFNYLFPVGQYKEFPYDIPLSKFTNFYIKNIIKYYTNDAKITDLSLTDPNGKKVGAEKIYCLSPNNFKPNSINPNRLVCWFYKQNNEKCHNINNILATNSLNFEHFTPAIQNKINGINGI